LPISSNNSGRRCTRPVGSRGDRQDVHQNDLRPTEAGFPCHQVGAETQRERDTGKAPPTHRLHVCWARRPLTPSRAAILASLLPSDVDPEAFVLALGIRSLVANAPGVDSVLGECKQCCGTSDPRADGCLVDIPASPSGSAKAFAPSDA